MAMNDLRTGPPERAKELRRRPEAAARIVNVDRYAFALQLCGAGGDGGRQVAVEDVPVLGVPRSLAGQIVDAMWGEAVPRTASTQIRNMVSALRHTLVDGPLALATVDRQPAGYRLRITDGELDLAVFTTLLAQARAADSPDSVARTLRHALGMWRGTEALAGIRADFADSARAHLHEMRNAALEDLFDAELACANHAKIVAGLTKVVADNPGRERLAGQLMIALHRSGRTTDALGVYRRVRRTLAEQYGLEPGATLRELERSILLDDRAQDQPLPRTATTGSDRSPSTADTADTAGDGRPADRTPHDAPAEGPGASLTSKWRWIGQKLLSPLPEPPMVAIRSPLKTRLPTRTPGSIAERWE